MNTNMYESIDYNIIYEAFKKCKKGGFLYLKFNKMLFEISENVGTRYIGLGNYLKALRDVRIN